MDDLDHICEKILFGDIDPREHLLNEVGFGKLLKLLDGRIENDNEKLAHLRKARENLVICQREYSRLEKVKLDLGNKLLRNHTNGEIH